MRDNVEIYTTSLIHAILDSREYREFKEVKHKLAGNVQLKEQINAYRRENYRLQKETERENLFRVMEEFQKEHAEFLKDPLVAEYLKCELAMCRMLQKIWMMVVDSVDLELEDVAKDICC